MARNTALTEGLHGPYNKAPIQTGITVPFTYLAYIKKRIEVEERGSLSLVIRELLVKEFGCPADETDEITIIRNIRHQKEEEALKRSKASARMKLMEQAAEDQAKADLEDE